jgi:hypothetical protein
VTKKAQDRLIENIYREHCSGMQIDVMRIGKLFAMARAMLNEGADHATVGKAMVVFVSMAA